MHCSNCGEEITDGMKFCPNCGNSIAESKGKSIITNLGAENMK